MKAGSLLTSMPEKDYVGTVLSPWHLMDAGQQDLQPHDLVMGYWDVLSLTTFCERQKSCSGIGGDKERFASDTSPSEQESSPLTCQPLVRSVSDANGAVKNTEKASGSLRGETAAALCDMIRQP